MCTVNASGCSFFSAVRTSKPGHYFYKFSISGSLRRFLLLSAAGALDDEEFFIIEGSVSISLSDRCSTDVNVIIHSHQSRPKQQQHDAPRRQKPPPPQAFFQLFDEEDADKGMRPPQERVQLRTVEHIADVVPVVQILDIPVPQKVERLADFLVLLDTQTPVEQVIAVPKISNDSIQPRLVDCDLRRPQNSLWKYRRCCPMLYSSSRLPSRSLPFRFLVVIAVREVFKIFFQNRVLLRLVEQIIVLTLQFVLVLATEVCKVLTQDRVQRRFLELNTN